MGKVVPGAKVVTVRSPLMAVAGEYWRLQVSKVIPSGGLAVKNILASMMYDPAGAARVARFAPVTVTAPLFLV
jgi:hypothetical protein